MTSLIGKGAYGCAYKPAIECEDDPTKHLNYKVGKIFTTRQNAEDEWNKTRILRRIDPQQNSFIFAYSSCPVNIGKIPLRTCKHVDSVPKRSQQFVYELLMDDGGDTLKNIIEKGKSISVYAIIHSLLNIAYAIEKLLENNLIHQDIKSDNIIINDENYARILDFGQMTDIETFYDSKINTMFNNIKRCSPPESSLSFILNYNTTDTIDITQKDEYITSYITSYTRYLDEILNNTDNNVKNIMKAELIINSNKSNIYTFFEKLFSFCEKNKKYHISVISDFRKHINSHITVDTYGFGIILFEFLPYLTGEDIDIYSYCKLICDMINPNPYNRINIIEIINRFHYILISHTKGGKY